MYYGKAGSEEKQYDDDLNSKSLKIRVNCLQNFPIKPVPPFTNIN